MQHIANMTGRATVLSAESVLFPRLVLGTDDVTSLALYEHISVTCCREPERAVGELQQFLCDDFWMHVDVVGFDAYDVYYLRPDNYSRELRSIALDKLYIPGFQRKMQECGIARANFFGLPM